MRDAPTRLSTDQPIFVDATNHEILATGRSAFDMLALQLAPTRCRVAVNRHLVVSDQMLRCIEVCDRARNTADDGIDSVAEDATQFRSRSRCEDHPHVIELAGIQRPGVRNSEVDDRLLIEQSHV